jgi:outer membrane protein assembly factor BamA
MKLFLALAFAAAVYAPAQTTLTAPPTDQTEGNSTPETNVNSRYTVESVGIANLRHYHVSRSLLEEMQHLVGDRFSSARFQNLAERISEELHGHQVVFKLSRGADPDHVRVTFEVHAPKTGFDVDVHRVLYNSRQGFSGEGDAVLNVGANQFTFGALSDGDSLVERASGIRARYDRLDVGSDRVRLSFEFDSYHQQYNRATTDAANATNDLAALYRTRQNFEPCATVKIAGPVTWTVGLSFQQLEQQLPAARTDSSNAVVNTLRYDRQWEDSGSGKHRFSAAYSLRAATSFLGSAFAYTRHAVDVTYHWKRGHQSAEVGFLGGAVAGKAPLFDRFVLGTSTTLRGWDKYDLDPLGGNRVAYGSVGYGYHMLRTFYDTGAIWDKGTRAKVRQSAGIGVKVEGILFAVAFPIRGDHMEPIFIAGMNF